MEAQVDDSPAKSRASEGFTWPGQRRMFVCITCRDGMSRVGHLHHVDLVAVLEVYAAADPYREAREAHENLQCRWNRDHDLNFPSAKFPAKIDKFSFPSDFLRLSCTELVSDFPPSVCCFTFMELLALPCATYKHIKCYCFAGSLRDVEAGELLALESRKAKELTIILMRFAPRLLVSHLRCRKWIIISVTTTSWCQQTSTEHKKWFGTKIDVEIQSFGAKEKSNRLNKNNKEVGMESDEGWWCFP